MRDVVNLLKHLVKLSEFARGQNHFLAVATNGVQTAAATGGDYIYAIKALNGDVVLTGSGTIPVNGDFTTSSNITIQQGDVLNGIWERVNLDVTTGSAVAALYGAKGIV